MFDVGLPEFFVLGLIALLVFGPERLPEVALQAARMIRKLRNMAESAKADLTTDLEPHMRELKELRELDPRKMARKYVLDPADEDGTLAGLTKSGRAKQAADARRKAAAAKADAAKPSVGATPMGSTAAEVGGSTAAAAAASAAAAEGLARHRAGSSTDEGAVPVVDDADSAATASPDGPAVPPAMASASNAPEPPPFDSDAT